MKPSHLLAILVRLFAIFLVISAIRQFSVVAQFSLEGQDALALYSAPIALVELLLAIVLWMFPLSVAMGIVKPEIDQDVSIPPIQGIMYTSITLLGLYMACYAIVDIAYWISIRNSYSPYLDQPTFTINPQVNASLVKTSVEAIIGLALIIKAKTVARLLTRISS